MHASLATHAVTLSACAPCVAWNWSRKERPKFAEALTKLRGVVPPDILRTTRRHLEAAGMPEPLLKRLWDKRVLWFVRMQPTAIAKLHMADLATKYVPCPFASCFLKHGRCIQLIRRRCHSLSSLQVLLSRL
jgi:hypothetical protein